MHPVRCSEAAHPPSASLLAFSAAVPLATRVFQSSQCPGRQSVRKQPAKTFSLLVLALCFCDEARVLCPCMLLEALRGWPRASSIQGCPPGCPAVAAPSAARPARRSC